MRSFLLQKIKIMRARFFDDSLNNMFTICKKMLDQLEYTYNCRVDMPEECLLISGNKNDYNLVLLIKQARKGLIKVTVEIKMPIRSILDYEKKKKAEVSLLNSIEIFLQPTEEVELGI